MSEMARTRRRRVQEWQAQDDGNGCRGGAVGSTQCLHSLPARSILREWDPPAAKQTAGRL
jgi:hypothetical protein